MAQLTLQQTFELASQQHQAGRLSEAEQLYRQILEIQPDHVGAMHYLAAAVHHRGQNNIALELIRQVLALRPDYPDAHSLLGTILHAQGQIEQAVLAQQRAIALDPNYAEAYSNLGNALKDHGQVDEAIAAYEKAIALKPNFIEAHSNLGSVLKDAGQSDAAVAAYRQALACNPDRPEAHNNLGNALIENGQVGEAIGAYRQAIAIRTDYAEAHNNLGNALANNGQLDAAIAAYRRAIACNPSLPEAHNNLGNALEQKGQLDDAIAACRQAIALRPEYAEAHNNLGTALHGNGQTSEALAAYRRAIALKPDYAQAHSNLGSALANSGQTDQAIAAYRQAIALSPNLASAHSNLAMALKDAGKLEQAIAAYRHALMLCPDYVRAHSNLVYTLHFHPAYDVKALAHENRCWSRQHAEPLQKLIRAHPNDRSPERRLRVGYVSADFRAHVSAHFLIPLLEHHDPRQVELFCYAQVPRPDALTRRLQRRASKWRSTVGLSDEQVAGQIREDRIDVLVDLKLHTANNRLLVFARKPAPVQVTWLGYPGSTGLTAIDYRFTDPYLDPPGMDESIYSEKTIRLPDTFWCYDPLDGRDIPVNALPAVQTGVITFGCLNNFIKINDRVVAFWGRVLQAVENSRLLLLCTQGSHRQQMLDRLSQEGIAPGRIEFVTYQPRRAYLELYHRLDLCLDPFPYNGHTTSLDSFWMGVPVVTLVGQTAVSRAGWCQLSNLGLPELAAQTAGQFVAIAVELAKDLPRLKELRSTLRRRMEQSPLMDAPKFARNIEAAYRQMWRTWCEKA